MRFEFATAGRIIFGEGSAAELPAAAAGLGTRALFVTGKSLHRSTEHRNALNAVGVHTEVLSVAGEPTVALVREGLQLARASACDLVIALGGGSALDAGKAIAGLLPNPGDVYDYLEVVGKGNPLPHPALPFVAVPTAAGTGSETTRNAVLYVPERRVKVSLRHASMLPRVAIVDPDLTYGLPRDVTASTGLDALVQLIEPFVSNAANPMVDAVCREGIRRIVRSLRVAWQDGSSQAARSDMALAALFSGMALANARLGAVHGFAAVIGGRYAAPHGAVCARLLAPVVETNVKALRARSPQSDALLRYDELARLLTGQASARADEAVTWLGALCADLQIPALSNYGMAPAEFPELIEAAKQSSSMKGNPISLLDEELNSILMSAA